MISDHYLVKKSFGPMIADQEKINGSILIVGNVETNPGPQGPSSSSSQNVILDKTISLCNLNIPCRNLRNKIDFLNDFAEDFDILLLTETHLSSSISARTKPYLRRCCEEVLPEATSPEGS
jgi:hypothetical protein